MKHTNPQAKTAKFAEERESNRGEPGGRDAAGIDLKKIERNQAEMATLIKCPTCGKQVSSNAATCPGCGEVINAQMTKPAGAINLKDPVHLIGVILAGLVILGVIVAIIARFASL